jgi:glycosyltransferase involved in cell wall biosynthesis
LIAVGTGDSGKKQALMRIGITLESLDPSWGGIGIYTEEIVRHLLRVDPKNEYFLMYPGFGFPRKLVGRYRRYRNATEVETDYSRVPFGTYWDQVIVPGVAKHFGIEVVFNPFLSVPVRGKFKKVMVMHNIEYYTIPKVYDWKMYSRWFLLEKVILPAADRVISISQVMTSDFARVVKYPIEQVRTIYHGVSERFKILTDAEKLREAKEEYCLPDKFILFVGHLYPQKNFSVLARAFASVAKEFPHDLVIAGRPRWKYEEDLQMIANLGLASRVHLLHFVPNDDLPALYNQAACLVYPSLYESFGLVQLEAMACGCPVLGANSGAIPEIGGGASLLFDPHNSDELVGHIRNILSDPQLRQVYVEKGLHRAKQFTWEKCALETLRVLEEAVSV